MEQLPRDLIVPFVYHKNKTAWGRNIRVVAWNYSESGDGKSMLDGHFAYFQMNVRSFVLGEQKNVDSPRLAYLAATYNEKPESMVVNSTVLEVRVPAFKFSGRFNVPGIRAQKAYTSAHREREAVEALERTASGIMATAMFAEKLSLERDPSRVTWRRNYCTRFGECRAVVLTSLR